MNDHILQEAAATFQKEWGIQPMALISEEAILKELEHIVIIQLEKGPEAFFQLMYRLDISEKKLNMVLQDNDVAAKLARLIYDRQLQKIQSKLQHRGNKSDEDQELKW